VKKENGGDTLFKKKQVLTVVSVAVISFLLGTMFNVMAKDSGGNPWDKVWTAISGLESRIETLENQSLPQGFINAPAYDSGWMRLPFDSWINLTHNLNTTELSVYMIGRNSFGVHQIKYGGDFWYTPTTIFYDGAWWRNLSNTTILIINRSWTDIRVMIWKISEPPA